LVTGSYKISFLNEGELRREEERAWGI